MNREFKFRAWDKSRATFVYWDDLAISPVTPNENYQDGMLWESSHPNGELKESFDKINYVFQQYTGLKTNAGQEIYEGDILKIKQYNDKDKRVLKLCEVKFGKRRFFSGNCSYIGFYLENKCGYCLDSNEITSFAENDNNYIFEIVGNIFENPELLNQNNA